MAKIVGISAPNKSGFVTYYFTATTVGVDGLLCGSFSRKDFLLPDSGKPAVLGDELDVSSSWDPARKSRIYYPSVTL